MSRINFTERDGIDATSIIFNKEFRWIFREQPLVDVGIDALVEQVYNGNPTGKFISNYKNYDVGFNHNSRQYN